MRGTIDVNVEVFPAFSRSTGEIEGPDTDHAIDYAQDKHTTEIVQLQNRRGGQCTQHVVFRSVHLCLELNATIDCGEDEGVLCPKIVFQKSTDFATPGQGVCAPSTSH